MNHTAPPAPAGQADTWARPGEAEYVSGLSAHTLAKLAGRGLVEHRMTGGGHRRYRLVEVGGVQAVAVSRLRPDPEVLAHLGGFRPGAAQAEEGEAA